MPETQPIQPQLPQLEDKRPKILGLLPKNTQHRFLLGIALLMMLIIALSGKNPPKPNTGAPPAIYRDPMTPNPVNIREYRERIEEEARRLAAEEAQLAKTKHDLGLSSGPQTGATATVQPRGAQAAASPYPPYWAETARSTQDREREKREAQAPFASNIALSYRQAAARPSEESTAATERVPGALGANAEAAESGKPGAVSASDRATAGSRKASQDPKDLQRANGPEYRLFEGTVIETVLINRLNSSFSGPVECLVTTNNYSHDGQHVIIPQGSRVLGEVRKLQNLGEQRLAVTFHRLIMPDGYSVDLDKFQGSNQIGETGLRDQVNHHYLQIFGVSLAIGAIAGLAQANTRYGVDASALDAYRQGVATSVSQSSLQILDRYLNILPTFTIREGHRVKIFLSQDLMLPAYEAHQMPSDL
jgi:type IV secretion system protein VirB10